MKPSHKKAPTVADLLDPAEIAEQREQHQAMIDAALGSVASIYRKKRANAIACNGVHGVSDEAKRNAA